MPTQFQKKCSALTSKRYCRNLSNVLFPLYSQQRGRHYFVRQGLAALQGLTHGCRREGPALERHWKKSRGETVDDAH